MAKVFGVHQFELKPGIRPDDFERFLREEVYPVTKRRDVTLVGMKGDRGERIGKYLILIEVDDVPTRDRYFPASGGPTDAGRSFAESWWAKFEKFVEGRKFTDYVAVDK